MPCSINAVSWALAGGLCADQHIPTKAAQRPLVVSLRIGELVLPGQPARTGRSPHRRQMAATTRVQPGCYRPPRDRDCSKVHRPRENSARQVAAVHLHAAGLVFDERLMIARDVVGDAMPAGAFALPAVAMISTWSLRLPPPPATTATPRRRGLRKGSRGWSRRRRRWRCGRRGRRHRAWCS
jgi:hypothetical protein